MAVMIGQTSEMLIVQCFRYLGRRIINGVTILRCFVVQLIRFFSAPLARSRFVGEIQFMICTDDNLLLQLSVVLL